MLHVTCDQAGVHTRTEWLLQAPAPGDVRRVPVQPRVLLLTVVTTYATDQHQALLGKQQGQPAQSQENNLGFLDRGEDYILPVLSRSCVWIYSRGRDSHLKGCRCWKQQRPCRRQCLVFRQTGINGFYLKLLRVNKLYGE